MKKLLLTCLALAALTMFDACKKNDNTPANTASVMFFNGCAGTINVNATVNGVALPSANNLPFLKSSGYQNVAAGTDNIAFVLTATGTPLTNKSVTLTSGAHYSVFIGGLVTTTSCVVLQDNLAPPSSGKSKIRFVNLSPDAMSVTANVGTAIIASGIPAQGASDFVEITAGSYVIKAGDPSNISTVVSTGTQQLSAGKIYTVVLTGTLSGSGTSYLSLTVINN